MAFGIRPARLAPGRGLAAVALSVALIAGVPSAAPAATVHVPSEQPTIQAGISAVSDGDTVYVAPDTYTGSGNRDIDFGGMNVSLMSTGGAAVTVINCEGDGRAFYFHTGEDTTSLIEGFTIREGTGDYGGAVRCQGTSPVFRSCIFFLNDATAGGGALHANSTSGPRLEN